MRRGMIKGLIFDLDGVLVDGVEWHRLALNRALSLLGHQIKKQEYLTLYNGLTAHAKIETVIARNGLPPPLHPFVHEMHVRAMRQILTSSCVPQTKLTAMLKHLKSQGLRLAVVSNSTRATVDLMMERLSLK